MPDARATNARFFEMVALQQQLDQAQLEAPQRQQIGLELAKLVPEVQDRVSKAMAAAKDEKEKLGYRSMLVRTYSDALDSCRGQSMRVRPVKSQAVLRQGETVVHSEYLRPGEAPVGVEYAMRKSAGEWKIYDITVDGISLVQTYRPVFDHVTRTEGVDGLVRRLKENGRPRPSRVT